MAYFIDFLYLCSPVNITAAQCNECNLNQMYSRFSQLPSQGVSNSINDMHSHAQTLSDDIFGLNHRARDQLTTLAAIARKMNVDMNTLDLHGSYS